MKAFVKPLQGLSEFEKIEERVKQDNCRIQIAGCIDAQKPHVIYSLLQKKQAGLIVTFEEQRAKELYEEYQFFDPDVVYYPAKDFLFYQADLSSNELVRERIRALAAITGEKHATVITTIDGLMSRMVPKDLFLDRIQTLQVAETVNLENLQKQLVAMGYEKNFQVESSGQFALRGGILDIFPLTEDNPYRIEFWDDEIDTIRSFDVESQRSLENIDEIKIYPAREVILDEKKKQQGIRKIRKESQILYETLRAEMKTEIAARVKQQADSLIESVEESLPDTNVDLFLNYFLNQTVSLADYFDRKETLFFLDEPVRLVEKGKVVQEEFSESMQQRLEKGYSLPGQMEALFSYKEVLAFLQKGKSIALSTLDISSREVPIEETFSLGAKSVNTYHNQFDLLVKDLKHYKAQGYQIILLSASRTRARRLADDLQQEELNAYYTQDFERELQKGEIMVSAGNVKSGFEYPQIGFVVISESDIFGAKKKKKKKRRVYEGEAIQSFTDLKVGDYVVHENHGLGIYRGMEKVTVDHIEKDYMKIEYADGGNLYILATQLELLQKYAGADAKKPKLNKLGGQEWNKTKAKVRGAVQEIAKELVELYAVREKKQGFAYGTDTVWQQEFEELFPFEETEDQLMAIEATKKDMESTKIMDRLICGDVGYGKTEIAIRAAFKAVQEGKQVVYLVPTTILAQQIYNTFSQRMKDFPVSVELLCRFRTSAQQKKTIERLKNGLCDIVVGTHRVLSKDISYKDLGLLIIDEEQRFGVKHKEKIKQLKTDVDVLTLTATPIPRTLHMSLIGIRDMSVLEEPPLERVPIQTYVMEYNEEMVREAIKRELSRGGQVYYVYNRVKQIEEVTAKIAELVPEATVTFAHGQMRERVLEDIMYQFVNGEIDVLVSTTIIETGLDIPNVNTMIIHDADNLGLSQLYQLRGRVGRSNRTAYAFLMYKRDKMLKEVAEKRLSAIKEFTDLGSGFKIAMRDLEIRGAGNLLGAQQHGHMEAVGYDLYCKMLNEAVKGLKGETVQEHFDTSFDMELDAYIPDRYIANEYQKLDIYKRIASITTEEESDEMLEELIDRFGDPPKSVQNLLWIARTKAKAHALYLTDVIQKQKTIRLVLFEHAKLNVAAIPDFVQQFGGTMKFKTDTKTPCFLYNAAQNTRMTKQNLQEVLEEILEKMQSFLF
ncbi:MAG: transcription-repair coupling factor [Lachnospiraceae bacterium]